MEILFWFSLITVIYIYIGYPLYIFLYARFVKDRVHKDSSYEPFVSIVLAAYNEEKDIEKKIRNLLDSQYPKNRLEILVGSDGSTDGTNEILRKLSGDRVRPVIFSKRGGKPRALNHLVKMAGGEIIVFCDARQVFQEDAVRNLAANFADGRVGCVSGELVFMHGSENNGVSEGVGAYWKYEKLMRKSESDINSMVGATGAIYAIRKSLFSPVPEDTILDDVYIPLSITRKGYRSVWDGEAKAYDRPSVTPEEERRRKIRTICGNYQIFAMFRDLFNPFRSAVAMPLFSHKLLRVLSPFFLALLFAANLLMAGKNIYCAFLTAQTVFYLLAIIGALTHKAKKADRKLFRKIAAATYMFCLMNYTALIGFYRFISGRQKIAWEKANV